MKRIFHLIFAAAIVATSIVPPAAFAVGTSSTLSWTIAVSNTDGSALAMTEIKETLITWRRPGSAVVAGSVRVPAPAVTVVVPGLVCGDFDFTGETVLVKPGVTSDETPPIRYQTGITCKPNPPSGLGAS